MQGPPDRRRPRLGGVPAPERKRSERSGPEARPDGRPVGGNSGGGRVELVVQRHSSHDPRRCLDNDGGQLHRLVERLPDATVLLRAAGGLAKRPRRRSSSRDRGHWYGYYAALSSANDVLTAIHTLGLFKGNADSGVVDNLAVLLQGLTVSQLALNYDRGFVVD